MTAFKKGRCTGHVPSARCPEQSSSPLSVEVLEDRTVPSLLVIGNGKIVSFNEETGAYIRTFTPTTELKYATNLAFGPDGNVYICTSPPPIVVDEMAILQPGPILRYSPDGQPLPSPGNSGAVFIPAATQGQLLATDIAFGPDGDLYEMSRDGGITRYNVFTKDIVDVLSTSGLGDFSNATGLTVEPDGTVYLTLFSFDDPTFGFINRVSKYQHGNWTTVATTSTSKATEQPEDVVVGHDGLLYVAAHSPQIEASSVLRYKTNGESLGTFAGVDAWDVDFGRNGDLYVLDDVAGVDPSTGDPKHWGISRFTNTSSPKGKRLPFSLSTVGRGQLGGTPRAIALTPAPTIESKSASLKNINSLSYIYNAKYVSHPFTVKLFVSADDKWDKTDKLWSGGENTFSVGLVTGLNSLVEFDLKKNLILPSATPFLIVVADPDNALQESNRNDNWTALGFKPDSTLVDFVVPSSNAVDDRATYTQVILHATAGFRDFTIEQFADSQNPDRLNIHYLIDQSGRVYQLAREKYRTNHAPPANYDSIGIELVDNGKHRSDPSWASSSLLQAAALLVRDILARHPNIPPVHPPGPNTPYSVPGVIKHGDLYGRTVGKDDPHYWDWCQFMARVTSGICTSLNSPANLLVTDPLGRRSGVDPVTGQLLLEIPGTVYTGPGTEPQDLFIPFALDGVYQIQVVGTGVGSYRLEVSAGDVEADLVTTEFTGETAPGRVKTYLLYFSSHSVSATRVEVLPDQRLTLFAAAAGPGGGPHVRVYNADGSERFSFFAYDTTFTGGVTVATGDVTGDGVDDIVTGALAGGGPHVKVFDGATGQEVRSWMAFDAAFTGGVSVAVGDVNGDGYADIAVGAGAGGGPHVKVFSGRDGSELMSFFAFDAGFRGGVSVAVADGKVITGVLTDGAPHVKVFTGITGEVLRSFWALDTAHVRAMSVAAGDLNGDGTTDFVFGQSGGGVVTILDGASGQSRTVRPFDSFPGGVRGAVKDLNGDGQAELLASVAPIGAPDPIDSLVMLLGSTPRPSGGPRVRAFHANGGDLFDFFAFDPAFTGGVSVG